MNIKNAVTTVKIFCRTNKPSIMLGAGLILGAGCIVASCIATLKVSEVVDECNDAIDNLPDDCTDVEKRKIYGHAILDISKVCIGPVALGGGSVALILGGFNAVRAEKAVLAAALSTVTSQFETYRARVVDRFGAETDFDIYTGRETVEVETEITNEKGKKKTIKTSTETFDPIGNDCYKKLYSEFTCSMYRGRFADDISRLEAVEIWVNKELDNKGYITYNDVCEHIGLDVSVGPLSGENFIPNGIGWVSRANMPEEYIGVYDTEVKFCPDRNELLKNIDPTYQGHERLQWWLTFNCYPIDGILEKVTNDRKNH